MALRIGILSLVLAASGTAHATCASWHDVLSPRSGEKLPPHPALYFFTRGSGDVWALVDGKPVVLTREHLGRMHEEIAVWRLHVPAERGHLVVGLTDPWLASSSWVDGVYQYDIDPAWRRPEGKLLVDREVSRFQWTCSSEDAVLLHPSIIAPAYRLDWAPTKLAFDRGFRSSLFFPTSTHDFFADLQGDRGRPPTIGLGKLDCFEDTFPEPPLGVYLEVVPLFADGDARYVPPPPAHQSSWDMARTAGQIYGPYLIGLGLLLLLVRRRR